MEGLTGPELLEEMILLIDGTASKAGKAIEDVALCELGIPLTILPYPLTILPYHNAVRYIRHI
jgi:hypothetical protein